MIHRVKALSETGARRQTNQDAILEVYTDSTGLFVVADGMGGHFRGDLASHEAVSTLNTWWEHIKDSLPSMAFQDVVADLEKKIRKLNEEIYWKYKELGQRGGTTLCLLLIHGNAYVVMNVGDSRLYKCQGWNCTQVTVDDVWENQANIRNSMSVEEIRRHPSCGKLMKAMGPYSGLAISVMTGLIEKKVCFMLCSDGIYKYSDHKWLMSQLRGVRGDSDVDAAAERIKKTVYKNGAGDNLSLIIALVSCKRV